MTANLCPTCGKTWDAAFRSKAECPNCAIRGNRNRVAREIGIEEGIADMKRSRQERRRRARSR